MGRKRLTPLLLVASIDVAALLEPIRAKHDVPGMVGAVVTREGAQAIGACGVRARGREPKLEADDRMHLGSCTKSMTATLCALLVHDGKLAWTTTVPEALPELARSMHAGWKTATLEQLVTNRAGAPGDVPRATWDELFTSTAAPRAQRETLARAILAAPPVAEPGTQFTYSNAGFAIAGLIAERAAGQDFEELMRARLFAPLEMASAGFGPPGTRKKIDEPLGHSQKGAPIQIGPGSDNPPAIAPAGRVHASLGDWARYVALHLRGETEGGLGLAREDFVKLHAPIADGEREYAMGWGVTERAWGGRVLTHSGSNTLWYCVAWLAPDAGFAVLAATNQGGERASKACDEASFALIQAWKAEVGREGGRK